MNDLEAGFDVRALVEPSSRGSGTVGWLRPTGTPLGRLAPRQAGIFAAGCRVGPDTWWKEGITRG